MAFDQFGELVAGFDVLNWVTFPNQSFQRIKVGTMEPCAAPDNMLRIHKDVIVWPKRFNQVSVMDYVLDSTWYMVHMVYMMLPFVLACCTACSGTDKRF